MARSDLLDRLLFDEASGALVASFFALDGPFEGDLLHTLHGNDRDQLTLGDLFAVTMLDVSVSPRGVRRLLLDDHTRVEVTTLLSDIPDDVDIWDGGAHLAPDGPAHRLWRLLQREGDGIGPTTAGKILARKRPRLLPIWDSIVDEIVQQSGPGLWAAFHAYLQQRARRQRLDHLRPAAGADAVPRLRMLDITLWMWGSQARVTKKAREAVGLPRAGWRGLSDIVGS